MTPQSRKGSAGHVPTIPIEVIGTQRTRICGTGLKTTTLGCMKIIHKYIFLIIFIILNSCESVEPENEYRSDQIFPLAVGNYWEYKYEVVQNDSLIHSSISKIEVIGKTNVNIGGKDISVYKVKETTEAYWVSATLVMYYLYNYETDGLYRYGHAVDYDKDYYIKKTIAVKYPIQKGDQWIEDHGDYNDVFTCLSTSDTVKIDNNKFICIRIRMGNGITWYKDFYYSKGIGLIQTIAETPEKGKTIKTQKLIKYKINKAT